jgi:hypothetical protein
MSDYTAAELAAQVNDPDCDHVGPYLKNRFAEERGLTDYDSAYNIEELLFQHGLEVNGDGIAVPVGGGE